MPSVEGHMIMVNLEAMCRLSAVNVGGNSVAFGGFQEQREAQR